MTTNRQQEGSPQQTLGWSPALVDRTARRTAQKEAAFLLPYLKPGMRLLDCGCGPGTITIGLAEAVAPGEATGIDIGAQQIELARANAAQSDTANVRFQVADVLKLPFEDNFFDVVYANTLIMYFIDKAPALKEMRRVLRPGGLIGIRDLGTNGDVVWPPDGPLERTIALYLKGFHYRGAWDPSNGQGNRGQLLRAGFVRCQASADCEASGTPESLALVAEVWKMRVLASNLWVEQGWIDRAGQERLAQDIGEWAKRPDAFHSRLFCSAIGWKEG
ncbi:MAG: methyltransferase domain-containing protein [Chloroflexi bacterium]|nr:methyltransferase domain-containing protein [Chloroflexota bacterium]